MDVLSAVNLYLPLNAPARLFIKRPNNIEGEHIHPIRKPEQLPELLKEYGLPLPAKLMLEGDELSYTEYTRLAACFPEATVVNGTPIIRKARSIKTNIEIEMFRRSVLPIQKLMSKFLRCINRE